MTKSILKKLPKSTFELEIKIPWQEIETVYKKTVEDLGKEMEIPGFRKGKAPKKLIEEKLNKNRVYEGVFKEVIPKAYSEAVKEHDLKPIISPKIDIIEAKEGKTWVLKATYAGKPKIDLKNYKVKVRNAKKSNKKIWTPSQGRDQQDKTEKKEEASLDDLINALLDEVEVELSDFLIEQESNRLLANLIDQAQSLGLTIEKYLQAKGKTNDQIKDEYRQKAEKNLRVEFVLGEIANKENITVSQQDLDQLISKVKDEKEKEKITKDSYYLAHLIRQQKTLDFLKNL